MSSEIRDELKALGELTTSYVSFQVLCTATELGLFTLLTREPGLGRDELGARLKLAENPIRVLLLACTSLGFLRKEGPRYYCQEAVSVFTLQETQRDNLVFQRKVLYRAMAWFLESLQQNTNVGLKELSGSSSNLYGRLAEHPDLERIFHDQMGGVTRLVAERLAAYVDLSGATRLMDVAGATGTNVLTLAKRWPHLKATIVDLPSVCVAARARVAEAGFADRIEATPCDPFTEELPGGADRILIAHFLEIWSIETIKGVLAKAYRALAPGGEILVVNIIQDDDETGPPPAMSASIYFLAIASGGGLAYTFREYEAWLAEAGFQVLECQMLSPPHGLVRATKPR